MQHFVKLIIMVTVCLFLTAIFGCDEDPPPLDPHKEPVLGMTEFVSADPLYLIDQLSMQNEINIGGADSVATEDSAKDRTVSEGDIYHVMDNHLIATLNSYRGLQLIDISDLSKPIVIGSLRLNGSPVEMYTRGNFAYLLLKNLQSYLGGRNASHVERFEGSAITVVDISDPSSPQLVNHELVDGTIQTSRMVASDNGASIYVASRQDEETFVQSFRLIRAGALIAGEPINLGRNVQDIHATPEALLVALNDAFWEKKPSQVAVIDISDPHGRMVRGATIPIAGYIFHESNMDLYKGILRVVSHIHWEDPSMNHLQTFDVSDIHHPIPVDHDELTTGHRLAASMFLGNKAFFVTNLDQNPLHTFEIDDDGNATEKMEYSASGWDNFFKAISNNTRLIGIGENYSANLNMAVSLYDITSLSNAAPLIARQEVAMDSCGSEANRDERAVSVLENAVSVLSNNGVEETGLILLPFESCQDGGERFPHVQLFTFSDQSLSVRGVIKEESSVKRSFMAQPETIANLAASELSLFDASKPDTLAESGRLNLNPVYSDLMLFGNYAIRVKTDEHYTDNQILDVPPVYETGEKETEAEKNRPIPMKTLEVIALDQNPNTAVPLAVLEIPAAAELYHLKNLLVTIEWQWEDHRSTEAHFQVYDLSDPEHPRKAGTLTTDRIIVHNYYTSERMPPTAMGFITHDPTPWNYPKTFGIALDNSIVFLSTRSEFELLGKETLCTTSFDRSAIPPDGGFYDGIIRCSTLEGEEEVCSGVLKHCKNDEYGCRVCEAVDPDTVETVTHCSEQNRRKFYPIYLMDVVDMTDPGKPQVTEQIEMARDEPATKIQTYQDTIYYSYKIPYPVADDPKSYNRHYLKSIDLTRPQHPVISPGINIPGMLLKAYNDAVYTYDFFWRNDSLEYSLNKLALKEDLARLKGRHVFQDQSVFSIRFDEQEHAVVHYTGVDIVEFINDVLLACPKLDDDMVPSKYLAIHDLTDSDLPALATARIQDDFYLQDVRAEKALLSAPGGMLVMGLDTPAAPYFQAFYPLRLWPKELFMHESTAMFAAGEYGIYQLELDEHNLLTE